MEMRERRGERERLYLQANHPRSVPTPESTLSPGSAPSGRRQDGSPWSTDWTCPTSPVAPSVCSSPAWAPLSQLANCGCTSLLGASIWGGGSHCCICFAKCNRTKQTERGLCHKRCCLHALSVVAVPLHHSSAHNSRPSCSVVVRPGWGVQVADVSCSNSPFQSRLRSPALWPMASPSPLDSCFSCFGSVSRPSIIPVSHSVQAAQVPDRSVRNSLTQSVCDLASGVGNGCTHAAATSATLGRTVSVPATVPVGRQLSAHSQLALWFSAPLPSPPLPCYTCLPLTS